MSDATQWHWRPEPNEVCSICGAPTKTARGQDGRQVLEHRAVEPDEGIDAAWLSRKKSPAGWQYTEVKREPVKRSQPKPASRKVNGKRKATKAKLPPPLRNVQESRRNSLVRYYYHKFEPAHLRDKSANTRHQYERALFKLCEFAQRDVTIAECSDLVFDRFVEWAIREAGMKFDTVRKYRAYLRRIVREARPGVCEKESGKRPHEPEAVGCIDAELDVEGSVWHFFREVFKPAKLMGRSELSANQYCYALRRLYRHFGRSVLVAELCDELVIEHLQWMLDQGFVPSTANSARRHLLSLWRFAHKKGLVDKLPDVDKLPEPKRLPQAWSVEQLGQILHSCGQQEGVVGQIPAADWWRALVLTIYDTGLRRRATFSIERQQLDLNEGFLMIPAEYQKNNTDQQYRLNADTVEAIRKIWLPERRLLFSWPREEREIWRDFGAILKRAGLPSGAKHKFHKIRRTTATHLASVAGITAASHHLGHSSETITKRYIDPRFMSTHDVSAILPRPKEL